MADQRIQYREGLVGANHPTQDDNINRLTLTEHTSAGSHRVENIYPSLTTTGAISGGIIRSLDLITKGPWVDIRAFLPGGFVTDGSVDYSTEIQAAIDSLPVFGGVVKFEGINYGITAAKITIPSGVTLRGLYGAYSTATKFTNNTASGACIEVGDGITLVADVGIENITVQAGTNISGIGIYLNYTWNCHIKKCKVINFTTGTGVRLSGSTTSAKASIQNSIQTIYLANNLTNLHLTGEDANNNSSSDEGYYTDVRINLSSLTNAKGVYIEAGFSNDFYRTSIIAGALISGTTAVYFDDGARSATYAAHSNKFYGIYIEKATETVHFEANCSGNIIHDYTAFTSTLATDPVTDNSGGGNIIRYPSGGLNGTHVNMYHVDQTYDNQGLNAYCERWEAGTTVPQNGFALIGAGATVSRDNTNQRSGTYCAAVTRVGNDVDYIVNIPVFNYLKGRYVPIGAWVKTSVANSVQIRCNDGVGGTSGAFHTGGGEYEYLTTRRKIDQSATVVQMSLRVRNTNGTAYLDSFSIQEGFELTLPTDPPAFRDSNRLQYSFTYQPASLANGAGETKTITVVGATLGDFVLVAAPYDLQRVTVTGYVNGTDSVQMRLQNDSGGVITLGSGSWKVIVLKD